MKIVKDGLYMYNDGKDLFIVQATGKTHEGYGDCFSGELVYDKCGYCAEGSFDTEWDISKFKRLDNKFTAEIED